MNNNHYSFKVLFIRYLAITMICLTATIATGCYNTINIATPDLQMLNDQPITVHTNTGIKYFLDKYSLVDSVNTLKGIGYEIKHDSRRPFNGTIMTETIISISYKEYDNSKTITFVSIYLAFGLLSYAIH